MTTSGLCLSFPTACPTPTRHARTAKQPRRPGPGRTAGRGTADSPSERPGARRNRRPAAQRLRAVNRRLNEGIVPCGTVWNRTGLPSSPYRPPFQAVWNCESTLLDEWPHAGLTRLAAVVAWSEWKAVSAANRATHACGHYASWRIETNCDLRGRDRFDHAAFRDDGANELGRRHIESRVIDGDTGRGCLPAESVRDLFCRPLLDRDCIAAGDRQIEGGRRVPRCRTGWRGRAPRRPGRTSRSCSPCHRWLRCGRLP